MPLISLIRGGGDLASGAVLRLARAGIQVVVTELPQPMAVRRLVSFAQAVYDGTIEIEGIVGHLVHDIEEVYDCLAEGSVPVLVDPGCEIRFRLRPQVIIDGRMTKRPPDLSREAAPMMIGLGPGFVAGENCHAVVETMRGPFLGRVYYQGSAAPDSGLPDKVGVHQADRVLRAPASGVLRAYAQIGDHLKTGQIIADVDGKSLAAPFPGMLRGLLMEGLSVRAGEKIGDLDPRDDARLCRLVSDKALAVGGGVMESILSRSELRVLIAH